MLAKEALVRIKPVSEPAAVVSVTYNLHSTCQNRNRPIADI